MLAAKPENRIVPSGSDALPSPAAVSAMTSSLTPFSAQQGGDPALLERVDDADRVGQRPLIKLDEGRSLPLDHLDDERCAVVVAFEAVFVQTAMSPSRTSALGSSAGQRLAAAGGSDPSGRYNSRHTTFRPQASPPAASPHRRTAATAARRE